MPAEPQSRYVELGAKRFCLSAGSDVSAELRARYESAGQGHVFKFLDAGLVGDRKADLLAQLDALDLASIARNYEGAMRNAQSGAASADITPPDDYTTLASLSTDEVTSWNNMGIAAVGRGEVAACVLAGGQGTRLGFDGPKGCYNIKMPSGKVLFQYMAERIQKLSALAKAAGGTKARIPFLVMTSPLNHETTTSFFAENNYFGLPAEDVWVFSQGTLPCLTTDGKIIMESGGVVATAPDGNGGFYPALQNSGVLARLQEAGVKGIHVFSVDNSLCRPADPTFIGYCLAKDAEVGNKCVWKVEPGEKIGVNAKMNGKSTVVEYSELDDEKASLRDDAGRLVFGAGNICNHYFSVQFLADTVIPNMGGLFHIAHKKIPFAGEDGVPVKPTQNNGIKLEAFIFDVFSMANRCAILECAREAEFAPVKNAPGDAVDSPDSARAMVSNLAKRWVREAGGKVEGEADALLEISPLLSYGGEGLAHLSGQVITVPTHLR